MILMIVAPRIIVITTNWKGFKMDRFDYYLEFMAMRLDDPQFRLMYGINEFDKWYADYMEILSQKHYEPIEKEL